MRKWFNGISVQYTSMRTWVQILITLPWKSWMWYMCITPVKGEVNRDSKTLSCYYLIVYLYFQWETLPKNTKVANNKIRHKIQSLMSRCTCYTHVLIYIDDTCIHTLNKWNSFRSAQCLSVLYALPYSSRASSKGLEVQTYKDTYRQRHRDTNLKSRVRSPLFNNTMEVYIPNS